MAKTTIPKPDAGLLPAVNRHTDLLNMLEVLGSKPSEADRLRGAVIEALHWLEVNAPSRAHEVLRTALTSKTS